MEGCTTFHNKEGLRRFRSCVDCLPLYMFAGHTTVVINRQGPKYCWCIAWRLDLRICGFRSFFRSLFRPSKMRPRTVTQPFVTVRGRHFRGRQADPVLKSSFFFRVLKYVFLRLSYLMFRPPPHPPHPCTPGRARSLPPPRPSLSSPLALAPPSSHTADPLAPPLSSSCTIGTRIPSALVIEMTKTHL